MSRVCFLLRLIINLSKKTKQNKTKNNEDELISVQCLDKPETKLYLIAPLYFSVNIRPAHVDMYLINGRGGGGIA